MARKDDPHGFRSWRAWRDHHQPFELGWWKQALADGHATMDDAQFEAAWAPIRDFIQPQGQIIDIGCGPRPPFRPCVAIEPLADEYRKLVPASWWDDVTVHSIPAEQRIRDLRGDTIICWNAIDHAIGWKVILFNMLLYGNPGARFAVATDFWDPFLGHPGFPRGEFMRVVEARFNIIKKRSPFGRHMALLLSAK